MTARLLTAAFLLALTAVPASAQGLAERGGNKLLTPFRTVVAAANESTVRILCDDRDAALGTVVFADGFILTKASELKGTLGVKLADGTVHDATIFSVHKETDLALVKIGLTGMKAIVFADSKKVPTGNWLAAAGPGSDPLAVGIVSVMTRALTGEDARVAPNANRGYLGVLLEDTEDNSGAKVTEVTADGGARKAGVKALDIIVEVDGKPVVGRKNVQELMEGFRPGDTVIVKVMRKGEEVKLKVTLASVPKSRGDIQNSMGGELSGRRTGFPAVLQTDMVVDPKNCGGPVVDLDGKVLGITIARAGRVETWILPSENIRPILAEMKAGKHPAPAPAPKKVEKDTSK